MLRGRCDRTPRAKPLKLFRSRSDWMINRSGATNFGLALVKPLDLLSEVAQNPKSIGKDSENNLARQADSEGLPRRSGRPRVWALTRQVRVDAGVRQGR